MVVFGFALGFLITSMLGLLYSFGGLYRDGRSVKNGFILGMSRFLIIDMLRLHSCCGLYCDGRSINVGALFLAIGINNLEFHYPYPGITIPAFFTVN